MTDVLERAKSLAQLVEAKAQEMRVPVTFTVVDVHGNLVLKHRMTGAPLVSLEMSERKAYTTAALGIRTADVERMATPGESLYTLASAAGGRYVAFGGGVPLLEGETLVAGAGVSGGTVPQDVEIIEAAVKSLHQGQAHAAAGGRK